MLDFKLLDVEEEKDWIKESEQEALRIEEENKQIHDELMYYRNDAIKEAVNHFLKRGRLSLRGNPDEDDSRYFFNKKDIEEVLKNFKEKGGNENEIGIVKVQGMETAWEMYRIDISENAKAKAKKRELNNILYRKKGKK